MLGAFSTCVRQPDKHGMFEAVSRGTASVGDRVFDGFMGRGTVGKVARELKLNFVGIDRDHGRIAIAREYLGC